MAKVSLLLVERFWPKGKHGCDLLHYANAFPCNFTSLLRPITCFVDILFTKSALGIVQIIQLRACDWQLQSEGEANKAIFDEFLHKARLGLFDNFILRMSSFKIYTKMQFAKFLTFIWLNTQANHFHC